MIRGERSIPKTAADQEEVVEQYERTVAVLQEASFSSKYVKVLPTNPGTPEAQHRLS